MACNLVAELRDHGAVDQTRLAMTFAGRCEPYRGYGAGAFTILREIRQGTPPRDLLGTVLDHLGDSVVRKGIDRARKIGDVEEAAYVLGNGSRVTAQDTVPFTLWGAAHHLDDCRDRRRRRHGSAGRLATRGEIYSSRVEFLTERS